MERAFIRKGHGYDNPSPDSGRTRCTAFDGFTVIANPLGGFDKAGRESRIFRGEGMGCDYSSHSIKLATKDDGWDKGGLFILMQHGGGREVLALDKFHGQEIDIKAALLAMPERQLYAMLYTIYSTAKNARDQAKAETRCDWSSAYIDGRIRKQRRNGQVRVEIETQAEHDARKQKIVA